MAVAESPGPEPQVLTRALESRKHIVFVDSALWEQTVVGPNSVQRLFSAILFHPIFVSGAVQEVLVPVVP